MIATSAVRPVEAQDVAGGTGAISGQVRDSAGTPLPDISVSIPQVELTTTTNDRGLFRFGGLPAGRYRVRVGAIGYMPMESQVTVVAGQTVRLDFDLVPRVGQLAVVVVRASERGLRGIVHDENLDPLQGARVEVYGTSSRAATGRDGRFRLGELAEGGHMIRITLRGFATRQFSIMVPPDTGLQIAVRMRPSRRAASNMEQMDWQDASQRRRWASRAQSLFMVAEELNAGSPMHLSEIAQVYAVAQTQEPCVVVDGRPSALPLSFFAVEDIEAIEVYPAPPQRGRSVLGHERRWDGTRQCGGTVYVWLKKP